MCRVLIAEDEPRIVAFLEKGLRQNGFSTTVAYTGEDAIQLGQSGQFDLMLLDLGLPDKDGWAVIDALSQTKPQPVVIIVTARDHPGDRQQSLMRGASAFITKPFRFSDLLACIRSLLREGGHG